MLTLDQVRLEHLHRLGIDPDSIPGRACLRGDWDAAPALREKLVAAREASA